MTPTPPSTTSSHSGHSPDAHFRVVRKRNRVPLSCAPCRHRKLKCNRQSPCDNCTKRGDASSCTYAALVTRKKGSQSHNSVTTSPDDMQNRIDRLEGLVLSLMTNGSQAPGTGAAARVLSADSMSTPSTGQNLGPELDESQMIDDDDDGMGEESETDNVTKSFGVMKVDTEKQKTFYMGEAHWAVLLSEIGEVKNFFAQHKKEIEAHMEKVEQSRKSATDMGAGPALLFGATVPPSRAEILAQIPSRYMADILIGRYFNTFDPGTHILHGPTFQKQYDQYWADPPKTSIVWIGMLFAMMRLAMISYAREGDEPPEFRGKCRDMAYNFRSQMAHCLITADYTKPHNHIIETLIFHLHAEYTVNMDSEASVWVLVGMIARLAMRMGYHRDSKLFPNLTPFQGEMRRRIWTFVRGADVLFSFQVALPSMIRIGDSDTDLPRNIYDDEFDEDCTSLPPARPLSESTPISYMIAKGTLALGFGRVLEEVNGVNPKGYDEILKIDRGLRDIFESLPDHLKLRPMSEQALAPINLIMSRFSLATLYHKSQCVLHRRFIRTSRINSRYAHSRRMCINSAMQLLSFQATLHNESVGRGRMRGLRAHVNSLTSHDFILAATVISMDLYNHRLDFDVNTPNTSVSGGSGNHSRRSDSVDGTYVSGLNYRREDLIKALEQSRDIWASQRDSSMEAYKAYELLNVLLNSLSVSPEQTNQMTRQFSNEAGPTTNTSNDEQNAAMTLGLLQSGGVTPNPPGPIQPNFFDNKQATDSYFGPSGDMSFGGAFGIASAPNPFPNSLFTNANDFGTGMNLDWDAWEQYMQPSNLNLDPAANLWSSTSPLHNNPFTTSSSADSNTNSGSENAFGGGVGGNSNFYSPPNIGAVMGEPTLSANSINTNPTGGDGSGGNFGEVFMGVPSPLPGGIPSWKWTVMNDKK